jgi:hypothetical protein
MSGWSLAGRCVLVGEVQHRPSGGGGELGQRFPGNLWWRGWLGRVTYLAHPVPWLLPGGGGVPRL